MAFGNPIVGANDTLIRNAIQSENFVTGVSGWRITKIGNAEFNSITIRDRIEIGPATGPQVIVDSTPTFGYIEFPTHGISEITAARILSTLLNPGAVNEAATMQIQGPASAGATDIIELQLSAQNNDATSQANFNLSRKGVTNSYMMIADKNDMLLSPSTNLRMQQFNGTPMTFIKLNAATVQITQGLLTGLINLALSGNLTVTGTSTLTGNTTVVGKVDIQSDMGHSGAEDTTDITNFNTTAFVLGTPIFGTTFIAPPSGRVLINYGGAIRLNVAAGIRVFLGPEVRTGGTIGSGTIHQAVNEDACIQIGEAAGARINAGNYTVANGLTPNATYNVALLHKNAIATAGAGSITFRAVNTTWIP